MRDAQTCPHPSPTQRPSLRRGPGPAWTLLLLLPLLLLLSACAGGRYLAAGGAALLGDEFARLGAAPAPPSLDAVSANRLLVQEASGNIITVDPDGGNRFALTADAGTSLLYSQPTWSPDGQRIAYSRLLNSGQSSLITVAANGQDQREFATPFLPFYIYWNPAGDRLAYLSNWLPQTGSGSIALGLINVDGEGLTERPLAIGAPLYFSWSPEGGALLTHVDNREVSLTRLDGTQEVLVAGSADFATPQWLGNGRLLYADFSEGRQRIVLTDLGGAVAEEIDFNGAATFAASPDGERLAFIDTDALIGANAFGPLYVLNLADDSFVEVSPQRVVYFGWSPSGERLLFMTIEQIRGQVWLHNQIWQDGRVTSLARFQPTATLFDQYLRFSDQYSRSQTFWSPDETAIVFSGRTAGGPLGVWVQAADGQSPPRYVVAGVYATWSPR